jgi:hypothetical protein
MDDANRRELAMHDYMPREQEERYGGEPMLRLDMRFFRNVLSIILIAAGGLLALWICMTIFEIFDKPSSIEIFNQIIPPGPDVREISIEGKELVLPSGVFTFMAYFIGVFLLAVAARIAIGLISAGVRLLQPSIQNLQMKIDSQFRMMEAKMISGMQKLEERANKGSGGS